MVFIGSGTANPDNRGVTRFGFRGARFTTVEALARGDSDATTDEQRGRDRYATAKWCNMVTTVEWARRVDPALTTFLCLDPGLMPGTGLARTAPAVVQLAWSSVLRWVAPLMNDTSTPERSGAAALRLLTAPGVVSGDIVAFDSKPSRRVWAATRDPEQGKRVFDETERFLSQRRAPTRVTSTVSGPPVFPAGRLVGESTST